jgi:hypothetical protein
MLYSKSVGIVENLNEGLEMILQVGWSSANKDFCPPQVLLAIGRPSNLTIGGPQYKAKCWAQHSFKFLTLI